MPRVNKPYRSRGWWVSTVAGKIRKLALASEPEEIARKRLADLLSGRGTEFANGQATPDTGGITVREACERFLAHAKVYHRLPAGGVSNEVANYRDSFRDLLEIAGHLPAARVDRRILKEARGRMVERGNSRRVINRRIWRIVHAWDWLACEEEVIPLATVAEVKALKRLPAGRSEARETEPVPPARAEDVSKVLPLLRYPWRELTLLCWHSGMRPGEACSLRVDEISHLSRGLLLVDKANRHKMAYRGTQRVIFLPWSAVEAIRVPLYLAIRGRREHVFTARNGGPPRVDGFGHAVAEACEKAGVDWSPNQLRHSFATRVRAASGLEAAQVLLGHAKADTTEIYAAVNSRAARELAERMG